MLQHIGQAAKAAAQQLALLTSAEKNRVLHSIADGILTGASVILSANAQDITEARRQGLSDALIDRLQLNQQRLTQIASDIRQLCQLTDPVGQIIDGRQLDSGLRLERRRVPLGVIGVIYEARPNVTADVAALCLKTGNAAILRGGKETRYSNAALVAVIQQALQYNGLPATAVQFIDNPDRVLVSELLRMDNYIDMLIPRGGASLHQLCREQSTIPVIIGGIGVCHIFIDESAVIAPALDIIVNAKTQRPSTCNSVETLLIHRAIAEPFLAALYPRMSACGVTLHSDANILELLHKLSGQINLPRIVPVAAGEYDNEFLSLDINVKLADNLDAAIQHIRQHGSQHSEAILTRNMDNATRFINEVDAAVVYINASTRFTDGAQFGLGAEIAVSTQKLHARGPVGLEALTTYKWIGYGNNSIRQ